MNSASRQSGRAGLLAALTVVILAAVTGGLPSVANATMTAVTPSESSTWSTLSVAAASGLGVTAACGPIGSLSATATLTWTPSTTSRLTSQVVLRQTGTTGQFISVATLSTAATTYVDTGLLVATTYSYEIRSAVNGFFTDTAAVSAVTPTLCT
ncbi:MAG: hypothetical protein NVS3B26_24660 [Mycobacteriales bacterium]